MLHQRHCPSGECLVHCPCFTTAEGPYMDKTEFLLRQKLTHKVTAASKFKSEGMQSGTGADRDAVKKTADTHKITICF